MPPRPAALAALALALAGCAGTPALRPAYGVLPPGARDPAWARAQALLRERDEEVALGDPLRGVLVTREREREVPCAAGTCRARDVLHLRLDDGRAAATLDRRLWDPAAGAWRAPADAAAVAAVVAEERLVLERLRAIRIEIRLGHAGEGCSAAPDCDSGLTCVSRRCVKVRDVR